MENKKVVKAGLGYMLANYLIKGITFFTIPIFSRMLSVSEYGTYNAYVSFESVLYVFVGLGISYSIKNAKQKYNNQLEKYISSVLLLILINSLLLCAILNISYSLYGSIIGFSRIVVNTLLIHSTCSVLLMLYNAYIALEYSVKNYIVIATINAICNVVLSIFFIWIMPHGVKYYGRILGVVLPLIFIGVYVVSFFGKKSKFSINKNFWKYGLDYGLPMIPHGISIVILSQFDRIMIRNMVGDEAAGLYSFAFNIYLIVSITATSLDNVWGPWFFSNLAAEKYDVIKKKSTLYYWGMLVFSLVIMLIAPEIILILGGVKYSESIQCVVPIVTGGFFAYLYTIPVQVQYYYEKTKFVAVGSFMAAVLNIILNAIFINYFGYLAAAYTTLITYFLYFCFHWILSKRILQSKKCQEIFDDYNMFLAAIIALVGCAVAVFTKERILMRWLIASLIVIIANNKIKFIDMLKIKLKH